MNLSIRPLKPQNCRIINAAFTAIGWNKPISQYERYLSEQDRGERVVLVALVDDLFAGYLTIHWKTDYPPFRDNAIPEIRDFNVLPQYRRQGVGTSLMERAERLVRERSNIIGIGVGMTADYGAAQRLYARRGEH